MISETTTISRANTQSYLKNITLFSSNMKNQTRQTINGNSNVFSTSESVLAQALPGSLSTPKGWYSEIINSSDTETNFNPCNSISIGNHEEYKTLNTADAPPMIFSSTNQANRTVNEVSSSAIFPSTNISSISDEYNNTSTDSHIIEEKKHILTKEEQNLIENVENREQPPVVIHKKLGNNTVTYKQNISVRYLQPPTPPPPEPIIIRKKKRIFLKLFLLFYLIGEIRPPPPCAPSPLKVR